MKSGNLIIHWESDLDYLNWGISQDKFTVNRQEKSEFGQQDSIFHHRLLDGWHRSSLGGVPLSNIHPRARDFAINRATLSRVQNHADYFRALILDEDTEVWESLPEWKLKAAEKGWHPKDRQAVLAEKRKRTVTPQVTEIANHFEAEIRRMAATSMQTAAYANGQTTTVTVKNKDIGFSRPELEDEIAKLLKEQENCCALTGYDFTKKSNNVHLKQSLDRKNSDLGYVRGNLQITTRAANFYKSASNEADWSLKAKALEQMAIAIQQRRKRTTES